MEPVAPQADSPSIGLFSNALGLYRFATVGMGTVKDRLISACVHGLARRAAGWPRPELVPLSEAFRVGEYLVDLVRRGHEPCINTSPSEAIRVCLAMAARGVSLEHVTFLLGAEPLTPARRATIEASGAKAVPTYGFSEGSNVGSQCPRATVADDVHVSLDAWAILPHARQLCEEETVDSLLLTGLRPACPKVLVNAEIGDYAVLETRRCGCLFDEMARVYLETQACARTLIASDIPAARHVVDDGVTGLLFRKGDVADLTATTLRAAADPALRAAIGTKARERVVVHSLDRVAALYSATIEDVLEERARLETASRP